MGVYMITIKRWLIQEESGQGMVEYALIIVLVAVMLVSSLKTFGEIIQTSLENSANAIP